MSRQTQRVNVETGARRGLFTSGSSVELIGVSLSRPDHYTKLLPSGETFLPLIMLPLRLIALAVLYATSTPRRMFLLLAALLVLLVVAH